MTSWRRLSPLKTRFKYVYVANAPGAAMPLQTALKHFRQEFEQGVSKPRGKAHQDPIPVGEI